MKKTWYENEWGRRVRSKNIEATRKLTFESKYNEEKDEWVGLYYVDDILQNISIIEHENDISYEDFDCLTSEFYDIFEDDDDLPF